MPKYVDGFEKWSQESDIEKKDPGSDSKHDGKMHKSMDFDDNVMEVNWIEGIKDEFESDFYNAYSSLKYQLKEGIRHLITRDFNFEWYGILQIILHFMTLSFLITFLFTSIEKPFKSGDFYYFSYGERLWIYIIVAIALLGGGTLVDRFYSRKYFFEILYSIALLFIILLTYSRSRVINVISVFILSIDSVLLFIGIFVLVLTKTSLLSRGRFVSLVFMFIIPIITPIIVIVQSGTLYFYLWIIILGLQIALLLLSGKYRILRDLRLIYNYSGENLDKVQRKVEQEELEKMGKKRFSIGQYIKIIRRKQILPYLFFIFFMTTTLGFYLNTIIDVSEDLSHQLTIAAIAGILSLPIIGILMDNVGRKPIAITTALAIGLIIIFSDYPQLEFTLQLQGVLADLKMAIFTIAALVILVYTVVMAGDKSSFDDRGRVSGLFLFATIGGIILGVQLKRNFIPQVITTEKLIQISDWGSALIFLGVVLFSTAEESFDFATTYWRKFLDRFYILTSTGTSIYSYNFSKIYESDDLNEDLVSGGLTGIQSMLQEISRSKKKIRVLDHGDLKIIFHHGKYTTAVLFVKKDLKVFHEKLARFHRLFEYLNREELENFKGNITKITHIEELRSKFFD